MRGSCGTPNCGYGPTLLIRQRPRHFLLQRNVPHLAKAALVPWKQHVHCSVEHCCFYTPSNTRTDSHRVKKKECHEERKAPNQIYPAGQNHLQHLMPRCSIPKGMNLKEPVTFFCQVSPLHSSLFNPRVRRQLRYTSGLLSDPKH